MRASWYAALTIAERARLLARSKGDIPSPRVPHVAPTRLALDARTAWKAQPPFADGAAGVALWTARLAEVAVDDVCLHALAEVPAEVLASHADALDDATRADLARVDDALRGAASAVLAVADSLPLLTHNHHRAWLRLVAPFVAHALPRLDDALDDAARTLGQRAHGAIDTERVRASLLAHVPVLVATAIAPSVTLELQVARKRGLLTGPTPEARFDYFVDALADPDVLPSFWERHPVLARHVATLIANFFAAAATAIGHLVEDWTALDALLSASSLVGAEHAAPPVGAAPRRLVALVPGEGDAHRSGRSVMQLHFADRSRIVYKPREATTDLGYAQVLAWLAARAPALPRLASPRVVSRDDRSYHAFVEGHPATSREELGRFYERQGMHLALLHFLGAADLHSENMIAAGEDPVLVDLEALFQPPPDRPWTKTNPANDVAFASVLGSLFLPSRVDGTDEAPGYDISALGAREGQVAARPVRFIVGLGTDDMRATLERPTVDAIGVRPSLDGADADPSAWVDRIVAGFTNVWNVVADDREAFVAGPLTALRDAPIRVILRATMSYYTLLVKTFHPQSLDQGPARDRVLDHLYVAARWEPALLRAIASERADLERGDIPIFTMHPTSRDLVDARGGTIPDFVAEAPWDAAVARVRGADDSGLARQRWLIEASFATIPIGKGEGAWRPSSTTLAPAPITRDALLARAHAIGLRIEALAIRTCAGGVDRAGWLGLDLKRERDWSIVPSRSDLYAGGTGIALFLAHLDAITGEARFRALARAALETSRLDLDTMLAAPSRRGARPSLGATGSLLGTVYAHAHLARLWSDDGLLDRAEAIVATVGQWLDDGAEHDVIEGLAGAALALVALDRVRSTTATRAAVVRCGVLLAAAAEAMPLGGVAWTGKGQAEAPLGGFSHGATGIAHALTRIAARNVGTPTDRLRLQRLACEALAYERTLYDPSRRNWRDLRRVARDAETSDAPVFHAWCHGAPGIGLGLLAIADELTTADEACLATARADARIAISTTLAQSFGQNHSLCHGDFGNLELLFGAAERGLVDRAIFEDRLARTCASVDREGPSCGVPRGVETPGLFVGLAGIGWQLLRFAAPTRVPNLLLFDPPPNAEPPREEASRR